MSYTSCFPFNIAILLLSFASIQPIQAQTFKELYNSKQQSGETAKSSIFESKIAPLRLVSRCWDLSPRWANLQAGFDTYVCIPKSANPDFQYLIYDSFMNPHYNGYNIEYKDERKNVKWRVEVAGDSNFFKVYQQYHSIWHFSPSDVQPDEKNYTWISECILNDSKCYNRVFARYHSNEIYMRDASAVPLTKMIEMIKEQSEKTLRCMRARSNPPGSRFSKDCFENGGERP